MNAEDYAGIVLAKLTDRVAQETGILAHVPDADLNWIIREIRGPFTDEERAALFTALRTAADEEALEEALITYVHAPAWLHWWRWLLEHWDEVAAKVEYERGRAERCRAYEAKLKNDPAFAASQKIYGSHWKSEDSDKVVNVWEALKALREADEQGDDVEAAFARLHEAQESDGGNWWETITNYFAVQLDFHGVATVIGNKLRSRKADAVETDYSGA